MNVFQWNGRNQAESRVKAGEKLAEHLNTCLEIHPTAMHYVIAHSHGGNVTLYALRDARFRELLARIHGVVCLSTPFLIVRKRELQGVWLLYSLCLGLLSLICFALVFWSILIFVQIVGTMSETFTGRATAIIETIVFIILVFYGEKDVVKPLVVCLDKRWRDEAYLWRKKMCLPRIRGNRLKIMRASGDEASAAIGLLPIISWLSGIVIRFITNWIHLPTARIFAWLVRAKQPQTLNPVSAAISLLPVLAYMGLIGVGLLLLGRVALYLPLLHISAEPTPLGVWESHHLREGTEGLMHSLPYSSKEATDAIVNWITKRGSE